MSLWQVIKSADQLPPFRLCWISGRGNRFLLLQKALHLFYIKIGQLGSLDEGLNGSIARPLPPTGDDLQRVRNRVRQTRHDLFPKPTNQFWSSFGQSFIPVDEQAYGAFTFLG